jgi:hypothetical protein
VKGDGARSYWELDIACKSGLSRFTMEQGSVQLNQSLCRFREVKRVYELCVKINKTTQKLNEEHIADNPVYLRKNRLERRLRLSRIGKCVYEKLYKLRHKLSQGWYRKNCVNAQ